MSKPREWFLNPIVGYKCEVNENSIGLTGNELHVIEYSAYEKLLEDNRRMAEALKICAAVISRNLTAHEQTMKELE